MVIELSLHNAPKTRHELKHCRLWWEADLYDITKWQSLVLSWSSVHRCCKAAWLVRLLQRWSFYILTL